MSKVGGGIANCQDCLSVCHQKGAGRHSEPASGGSHSRSRTEPPPPPPQPSLTKTCRNLDKEYTVSVILRTLFK